MSTKHVFAEPEELVLKALRGATALNPSLRLHAPSKTIYIAPSSSSLSQARVVVISGGGAGHEPAHAGYTGLGMLGASVSGDIFASPSAEQILTAIKLVVSTRKVKEILFVVNNYTGDRLNFGLAVEKAQGGEVWVEENDIDLRGHENLEPTIQGTRSNVKIETVVVADDVSLLDRPSLVGPRGLAGNILVCKILGAAAEAGFGLDRLKRIGDAVVGNLASVGVGLDHCHVPGRHQKKEDEIDGLNIKHDECELGLGLHNEPGVKKMKIGSPEKLVAEMLEQIISSTERRRKTFEPQSEKYEGRKKFIRPGEDETILYVNNLGGLSTLEMCAIVDEATLQLEKLDIHQSRILQSSYMTSLNAPGFSLSLLNLTSVSQDSHSSGPSSPSDNDTDGGGVSIDELLSFIDAPTDATSWPGVRASFWSSALRHRRRSNIETEMKDTESLLNIFPVSTNSTTSDSIGCIRKQEAEYDWNTMGLCAKIVESGIRSACQYVLNAETDLTSFDTIVGDGDCGETFSRGAKAVLTSLEKREMEIEYSTPSSLFASLASIVVSVMGGTSGAIFGLYFTALSNTFSLILNSSINERLPQSAPLDALSALSRYTPARKGDRTLVDALAPFCEALASGSGLQEAVRKAREGAEGTRGMRARLGRATYVGEGSEKDEERRMLPPDPGAWGVATLLEGLLIGLKDPENKA